MLPSNEYWLWPQATVRSTQHFPSPAACCLCWPSKRLAVKRRNGNNFHVAQQGSVSSTEGGASGLAATIQRNLQGTCFSRVRRERKINGPQGQAPTC